MTWKTTLGTHRLNLPLNPLPDAVDEDADAVANVANPNRLNLPDAADEDADVVSNVAKLNLQDVEDVDVEANVANPNRLNLLDVEDEDAEANVANPNRLNLPDVEDAEANMANPNVAGVVEAEVAVEEEVVVMAVEVEVDKALNNGETLFYIVLSVFGVQKGVVNLIFVLSPDALT